jgi:protease PrsW
VHTELALRAKGILLMRESGFDVPVDEPTREKFAELEYLEKSVGKTGLLALRPLLHMSHKDLWQLYMLGK